MASQIVCKHNKFGHCKFQDRCRNRHVNECCENTSCDISNCIQRHPKICKFYKNYGRCRFSEWCSFTHKENELSGNDDIMNKIKDVEKQLERNTGDCENKLSEIERRLEKFLELENQVCERENQIEELFKKFEELAIESNEKNMLIEHLSEKVRVSESRINTLEDMVNKKKTEEIFFQCSYCDFKTVKEHGLKIHVKRKHTSINKAKYPRECELCNEEFGNDKDLRKHMKSHTYKEAKFKCKAL